MQSVEEPATEPLDRGVSGVAHGSAFGFLTFLIYGIVEGILSGVLTPLLGGMNTTETMLHYGFLAALLSGYGLLGAVIGGSCAYAIRPLVPRLRTRTEGRRRALVEASIVSVVVTGFAVNVGYGYPLGPSVLVVLGVCALCCIVTVVRALMLSRESGSHCTINPWLPILVPVGLAWLLLDAAQGEARWLKAGLIIAFPSALYLFTAATRRLLRRGHWAKRRSSLSSSLALAAVLATSVVLTVCWTHRPENPIREGFTGYAGSDRLPNIILIILDTVRADHMSVYGYGRNTTPSLESFAAAATTYTRAVAASPVTLSSHATIFTGLYARSHGARYDPPLHTWGAPLAEDHYTLAEFLRDAGYSTAGIVANSGFLSRRLGFNQGFQYWDDRGAIAFLAPASRLFIRNSVFQLLQNRVPRRFVDKLFRSAEEISEEVMGVVDEMVKHDAPYFLFVNFMDAHWPYLPPAPYDTIVGSTDPYITNEMYWNMQREVLSLARPLRLSEKTQLVDRYDASIAYLDATLATLLDSLGASTPNREMLIIISSDHGEAFGEQGLVAHDVSLYQDQVSVPLLVKFPRSTTAATVDQLAGHVDLYPTIADAVGLNPPESLQGRSLLADAGADRAVASEFYRNPNFSNWNPQFDTNLVAIWKGTMKLIGRDEGEQELYDLSSDPLEDSNLAAHAPDKALELRASLQTWLSVTEPAWTADQDHAPNVEPDERTLRRLRALGYIR